MTNTSRPDRRDRGPPSVTAVADTFPRQYARTQRLTLGAPRDVSVSSDGRRIVFLRSRAGDDPVNCLWVADANTGDERLVADPHDLLAGDDPSTDEDLPAEERARRERARESASGITAYATDAAGTVAAFALGWQAVRGGPGLGRRSTTRRRRAGVRPAPRSHGAPRRVRERAAPVHRRARRQLVGARRWRPRRTRDDLVGQRRVHRRRGDGPLPRLLVEPRRRRDRGLPRRHRSGTALVHQRSGRPGRGAGTDRLPGRRHRQRRGEPAHLPDRSQRAGRRRMGPSRVPVPRRRALVVGGADRHRAVTRPAFDPGRRDRPHVRRDDGAVRRSRRRLGRAGAGLTPPPPRRTARRLRRPRRCPAPPRRRRAGHPAGSAGPRDRGDRRRRRDDHRQPDRRRDACNTCGVGAPMDSKRSPTARACTRPPSVARPRSCAAPPSTSPASGTCCRRARHSHRSPRTRS